VGERTTHLEIKKASIGRLFLVLTAIDSELFTLQLMLANVSIQVKACLQMEFLGT
jgi:hypothetical protein